MGDPLKASHIWRSHAIRGDPDTLGFIPGSLTARPVWTSVRLVPYPSRRLPEDPDRGAAQPDSLASRRGNKADMTDYAVDRHSAYVERTLGAHAAYSLHYHAVWSVRARRPLLQRAVAEALRDCLLRVGDEAGISILAFHIEVDHVHLLFSLEPSQAVASAVKRLKGTTSRELRKQFPDLLAAEQDALWSTGYFVRSLGDVNVAQAKAYLDRQRAHHEAQVARTD
jgi:putative transposase